MANTYYDVPTVSPYDGTLTFTVTFSANIMPYIPLIISAIDAELNRPDVWPEDQAQTALGYMEDLKAYLIDKIRPPEEG